MTTWQRRARLVIAVSAVAFAIAVAFALKRPAASPSASAARTDPGAVVEVTGGRVERFRLSREDVRVAYERQLTYADGATKLIGVTITAEERAGDRTFTVTGREGTVGQNESVLQLNGDVQLSASDGMTVRTDHASYSDKDGSVRATGPVSFSRGRMAGSGVGMTYDTVRDSLVISDRAVVDVAADERGDGAVHVESGTVTFAPRPSGDPGTKQVEGQERYLRFERDVTLRRAGQNIETDAAAVYLTPDETQIQLMELRGQSRIVMERVAPGGLQELTGRDMDLKYGADGQALEQTTIVGDSAVLLAGVAPAGGRRLTANSIVVALAPDGGTPIALTASESVMLTLPAERTLPERTVESDTMDSKGEPGRGLTQAQFRGNVEYRERAPSAAREASAAVLDVALEPAMAGFREARFSRRVHFVDGEMTSDAAEARYDLGKGVLELSGSEPAIVRPRVVNSRLAIDATRIDVTLEGPRLKAVGAVKSVVQPGQKAQGSSSRLPSMLKQDRPVNVTADALDYDGTAQRATYTGNGQLWQDDTSLKGGTIVLDDATGDLTAGGNVTTVTVRDSVAGTNKTERVRTIATATDFRYEEGPRRATYTGSAHMNSSDGDITAAKIELYLKAVGATGAGGGLGLGGDDLERAEAFDQVTLRDQNRTTTGTRLTYTTADQRYVVTGAPVKVLDECRRETIGRTLTYLKSADTITIDGNEQTRTQTKGAAQCP